MNKSFRSDKIINPIFPDSTICNNLTEPIFGKLAENLNEPEHFVMANPNESAMHASKMSFLKGEESQMYESLCKKLAAIYNDAMDQYESEDESMLNKCGLFKLNASAGKRPTCGIQLYPKSNMISIQLRASLDLDIKQYFKISEMSDSDIIDFGKDVRMLANLYKTGNIIGVDELSKVLDGRRKKMFGMHSKWMDAASIRLMAKSAGAWYINIAASIGLAKNKDHMKDCYIISPESIFGAKDITLALPMLSLFCRMDGRMPDAFISMYNMQALSKAAQTPGDFAISMEYCYTARRSLFGGSYEFTRHGKTF